MTISKKELSAALKNNTVREAANQLGTSPASIYRAAKKHGIALQSKSEAQKNRIKKSGHQRIGTQHSVASKEAISKGSEEFWASSNGKKASKKIASRKRKDWAGKTPQEKKAKLADLHKAPKRKSNELSRLAEGISYYLRKDGYVVENSVPITKDFFGDIVLSKTTHDAIAEKAIVIKCVGVMNYGGIDSGKFQVHYEQLASELETLGFQVVFVVDNGKYKTMTRLRRLTNKIVAKLKKQHTSFMLRN